MNLNNISKEAITAICEYPLEYRNNLLKLVLAINQSPTQSRIKVIEKISLDFDVPSPKTVEFLGIFLEIMRLFLHSTDKEFSAKLLELGFSNNFLDEFPLVTNRAKIVDNILNARKGEYNKLTSLKWRIDISLTNSVLVKKMPKNVILCLHLKNRRKYTINVNIKTFHKLRFNVALIVKEIANLKINQSNK